MRCETRFQGVHLIYQFADYSLDVERQELRRGAELVDVEPQVLDLLQYLIRNRERVVSKDDLIEHVWHGRIVSESPRLPAELLPLAKPSETVVINKG